MGKLNQVIAVVGRKKTEASSKLTEAYHLVQKTDLFSGIARTYSPKEEDGDNLPAESKTVQTKVEDLVKSVTRELTNLYDCVATQDWANTKAFADITVDGKVLLGRVPVTHLLFLEKQMKDIQTFISKLPTLDPSEKWSYDQSTDQYATPQAESVRTKKILKSFVRAAATKEHPAQVDVFHEDVVAGYWKTIKYSGAIDAVTKNLLLENVRKLHESIVKSREEANAIDAPNIEVGKTIFSYVFDPLTK